jgi:hypothetical protein
MKVTKEKLGNKYYWQPPHISRNMDDPKRTYVEKEKFLRVGEPNIRQEPHPRHSNVCWNLDPSIFTGLSAVSCRNTHGRKSHRLPKEKPRETKIAWSIRGLRTSTFWGSVLDAS